MNELLKMLEECKVALMPTTHFLEQQKQRKFALNVLAKATILAQTLKVGTEIEVAISSNGKATAIIKRISSDVAIIKTGWSGIR